MENKQNISEQLKIKKPFEKHYTKAANTIYSYTKKLYKENKVKDRVDADPICQNSARYAQRPVLKRNLAENYIKNNSEKPPKPMRRNFPHQDNINNSLEIKTAPKEKPHLRIHPNLNNSSNLSDSYDVSMKFSKKTFKPKENNEKNGNFIFSPQKIIVNVIII